MFQEGCHTLLHCLQLITCGLHVYEMIFNLFIFSEQTHPRKTIVYSKQRYFDQLQAKKKYCIQNNPRKIQLNFHFGLNTCPESKQCRYPSFSSVKKLFTAHMQNNPAKSLRKHVAVEVLNSMPRSHLIARFGMLYKLKPIFLIIMFVP